MVEKGCSTGNCRLQRLSSLNYSYCVIVRADLYDCKFQIRSFRLSRVTKHPTLAKVILVLILYDKISRLYRDKILLGTLHQGNSSPNRNDKPICKVSRCNEISGKLRDTNKSMSLEYFRILRELDPIVSVRMPMELMQTVDNVRIFHPNCSEAIEASSIFFMPILFEGSPEFIIGWICGSCQQKIIDGAGTTAYKTSLHTGYFQQDLFGMDSASAKCEARHGRGVTPRHECGKFQHLKFITTNSEIDPWTIRLTYHMGLNNMNFTDLLRKWFCSPAPTERRSQKTRFLRC